MFVVLFAFIFPFSALHAAQNLYDYHRKLSGYQLGFYMMGEPERRSSQQMLQKLRISKLSTRSRRSAVQFISTTATVSPPNNEPGVTFSTMSNRLSN
jgi:hypothetical protein